MSFWKAISLGMYLLGWIQRASQDGKISPDEVLEAISQAIQIVGIDVKIDIKPSNIDGQV